MAFKRSGVRLPLAPPFSDCISMVYARTNFAAVSKKKLSKSYKDSLPNCGCVADRKSSRRAGNLPSTARDVRALDVACTTRLSRPRRFSRHWVLRHNAQCNFGGLDHRLDG